MGIILRDHEATGLQNGPLTKRAPVNGEGPFAYFDFCDVDLMRSSSSRNSCVSSWIDLGAGFGGVGGKGITSDMVEPPLGCVRAVALFLRQLAHFCGAGFSAGPESAIINSNFVAGGRVSYGDPGQPGIS